MHVVMKNIIFYYIIERYQTVIWLTADLQCDVQEPQGVRRANLEVQICH